MKTTSAVMALALVGTAAVNGESTSLRSTMLAKMGAGGTSNCFYKCANLFDINKIWHTDQSGQLNGLTPGSNSGVLNEYIGCVAGCQSCNAGVNDGCQKTCKNTNWYNKNWAYNPWSGMLKFVDCGADDLLQQQHDCIKAVNLPSNSGGGAKLPKWFTDKTTACYNNPTYGVRAINIQCNEKCKAEATCTTYTGSGASESDCDAGTDASNQYSAEMCGAGVLKNIIEPDKACIFGCVQNLCQKGSDCMGNNFWSQKTNYEDCQLITPQAIGVKYTIVPLLFSDGTQSDGDDALCCGSARTCCSYKKAWAEHDPKQKEGVCTVAMEDCAVSFKKSRWNLNPKGLKFPYGEYPGKVCNELYKEQGKCAQSGIEVCPECRQPSA